MRRISCAPSSAPTVTASPWAGSPAGRPVGDSPVGHQADRTGTRSLALITGASGGIGYELARQFTGHGHDLVVDAEDERLESAARRLRETDARVRPVRADLRTREGVEGPLAAVGGLTVGLAALDAGVGRGLRGHRLRRRPGRHRSGHHRDRPAKPLPHAVVARGAGGSGIGSAGRSTSPAAWRRARRSSLSAARSAC
ncbi:SDR family NAD(P)-dependent oxidoreductase [Streptomyces sp. NPDC014676]|uniref:SDR family NAD(P)-dependent oxidoreductase n=1 Tax=Streptomyces sp. NPDC014676 TaxID=3364879 RepID=UPI0036F9512D